MKKRIFFTAFVLALFLLLSLSVSAERQSGEAWGICDGYIYSIVRDSSMTAFDVDNGGVSNGTTISLYHYYSENPWQKWQFIYNAEDSGYYIKDVHSGKYLTVENNSAVDGARLCIQPKRTNGEGQIFRVDNDEDSGTALLYTKSSNYQMVVTADENGGAIYQRTPNDLNYQRYRIIIGGGIFQFKNRLSGKAIDVAGDGRESDNNVVQYTRTAGCRWQQWKLIYKGNGNYKIMAMNCGLFLTAENSNENANIFVAEENDYVNQLFRIIHHDDGTYTILTGASGFSKAATPYNQDLNNDISIVQSTYYDVAFYIQKYQFIRIAESEVSSNGIYYYQCTATGKYAQVDDGSGSHLEQHGYNGTRKQQWRVEYVGNNFYKIINVSTGYALTAPDSLSSGQNIYTELYNGSDRQKWYFTLLRSGNYEIRCNYWDAQGNTTLVLAVGTSVARTNLDGTNIRCEVRENTTRYEWKLMGGNGLTMLEEESAFSTTNHFTRNENVFLDNKITPNTYSSYSVLYRGTTAEETKIRFSTSKYIEIAMHGNVESIVCSTNPYQAITRSEILNLEDGIFQNAKLIVLSACNCGKGGITGENFANSLVAKGARTVLAFRESVMSDKADLWCETFYQNYFDTDRNQYSIEKARNFTNIDVRNLMEVDGELTTADLNVLVNCVFGNRNV